MRGDGESNPQHRIGDDAERGDTTTFAILHAELRALAASQLRHERRDHTLNATALVNEAFVKLSSGEGRPFDRSLSHAVLDRGRFFALAAVVMRRILVDHARRRKRLKRGGGISVQAGSSLLAAVAPGSPAEALDTLALDEALDRLAVDFPDAVKVVEMRFFAGLSELAIAEAMGVTERTVRRHWTFAKAWLYRNLSEHRPAD